MNQTAPPRAPAPRKLLLVRGSLSVLISANTQALIRLGIAAPWPDLTISTLLAVAVAAWGISDLIRALR